MTKFKSNRKGLIVWIQLGLVLLQAYIVFADWPKIQDDPYRALPLLIVIGLYLWFYLQTYYTITSDKLYYRCAFIYGEIELNKIKTIEVGRKMFIGFRPALAYGGLVIKYNTYDEIYISPESNDDFIQAIKSVNSNVVIEEPMGK